MVSGEESQSVGGGCWSVPPCATACPSARVWRSANTVKDGKEATVCTLHQQSARTRERKCASVELQLSRCSAERRSVSGCGGQWRLNARGDHRDWDREERDIMHAHWTSSLHQQMLSSADMLW